MLSEAPPQPGRQRAGASARRVDGIPADVWIVGALVILAGVIRIVTLGTQSFWTDEALTAYETTLPFGSMIHTVSHIETTPPLYFVLIWGWAKLFGTSEVALRSVSGIAGIALVPIAYVSAKELFNRWAATLAGAFVALSPFMIWYSQEARSYMLLATLTGAAFMFFVRALRDPSRGNLIGWTASSALAVMTHFFAGFVIAPEAVWLWWQWRTRPVRIAVGVAALAQLAMVPFAFIDTGHGVSWIAHTNRFFRLGQTAIEFGVNTMFRSISSTRGLIAAGVLIGVAALLILRFGDQVTRRGAMVCGGIFAFGFFGPLLLGFVGQDYFLARNEIIVWLPLAVAFAGAAVVPRARVAGGAFAVAILAMFIGSQITIQSNAGYQRPQWRTLAHRIGHAHTNRVFIVASGPAANPLKWYLPGVDWVQPQDRVYTFSEVDVIGTHRTENVIQDGPGLAAYARDRDRTVFGIAEPTRKAPRGSVLLRRFKLRGWVVARFRLDHPLRATLLGAQSYGLRFFRRVPASLLVFLQRPTG
jgi:4-amino-4-deoxy-L-arabinose transferase-like glycosyltransferase